MAIVRLSDEFLKKYPGIIQAMEEYFADVERLIPDLHDSQRYEVHGKDIPTDDKVITPTFRFDYKKVIITDPGL